MPFYVYFLTTPCKKRTYIGATIDLAHRLRQHNGEIKGGAKATSGKQWERVGYVSGFPDWRAALQFEWKWKNLTQTQTIASTAIIRRLFALKKLLSLEKSTNNATPFALWESPAEIHWEDSEFQTLWDTIAPQNTVQ
jgi:predicted GIY-YIG superfamily endonuclease